MKNLLSREEYLEKVNEGFFRDTLKKGVDKVKSLFKIGMKKIKNFITIFDNKGNLLPVISLQAVADICSNVDGINVYVPDEINKSIIDAGGKGCETKATLISNDEVYDFGPKGKEFAIWMEEEKYKETIEYKNLMSIPGIIKECYGCSYDEAKELFEDEIKSPWEDVVSDRIGYSSQSKHSGSLKEIEPINTKRFGEILDDMVEERIYYAENTDEISREDGKTIVPARNLLVFGAPGIGKSTVPKMVIERYNKAATSDAKKISLISANCALIGSGDLMMPTMPKVKDILQMINNNSDVFPEENDYLKSLTDVQLQKIEKQLEKTKQHEADYVPQSWIPAYRRTGDNELDKILDACANGGVYTDEKRNTHMTGNGGILLFDEFLRVNDPEIFNQLMNFFLDREMNGWVLGSKWSIIACTNRPCDDSGVNKIWNAWNDMPANKSRIESMLFLEPNPEEWKAWALTKGCDKILLDFIFGEKTGDGEYPRWHTVLKGSKKQVKPITPRDWASAFQKINNYEIRKKTTIYQMGIDKIRNCIAPVFDVTFVDEICNWLEDNMDPVSLDDIIKSEKPQEVTFPKKNDKDIERLRNVLKNLFQQFKNKYEKNPEECTDEILSKIIIWLGTNYQGYLGDVHDYFIDPIIDIFPKGKKYDNTLHDHKKSVQLMYAAWPEVDTFESIENDLDEYGEDSVWTDCKDNYEERLKELMKEYFPWRLKLKDKDSKGDDLEDYDIVWYGKSNIKSKKSED